MFHFLNLGSKTHHTEPHSMAPVVETSPGEATAAKTKTKQFPLVAVRRSCPSVLGKTRID